MAKRIDVLAYLPGYHREYETKDGKKTNQTFVSEDGKVRLSVRQAQDVAHGRKTLTQAVLTSFKGKQAGNLEWKIPTTSYQFKDFFQARDFVLNNPSGDNKKVFITMKGKPHALYPNEKAMKDGVWRAPLPPSYGETYRSDKYWEKLIDKSGDLFEGDPGMFSVIYIG